MIATQEIIFNYLIAILPQKDKNIQSFEILQNFQNFNFVKYDWAGTRFQHAHKSIFLITKIVFDHFISTLALKTKKIHLFEIHKNQKTLLKKWKF